MPRPIAPRPFATGLALALAASCLAPAVARAEDVESPIYRSWAGHKVGTTVVFRETIANGKNVLETTRTQTLTKLTPDEALIDEEQTKVVAGKTEVISAMNLSYKKKFLLLPGVSRDTLEAPTGIGPHGVETIQVAGKEYRAHFYETEAPTDHGPARGRTWISGEVPGKVLRSVIKVPSADKTITQELLEIKLP